MKLEVHEITSRDQWLNLRLNDITASEISTLFGVEPAFKTRFELFHEKRKSVSRDIDSDAMRRGRWLEPAGLECMNETKPEWGCKRDSNYYRDATNRLGATPDLVNKWGEPVEIKLPTAGMFKKWDQEPPLGYQLQTLMQAMLMDAECGHILGLFVDGFTADYRLFRVPRNERIESRMRAESLAFWDDVNLGREPAPDYTADAKTIAALNSSADGTTIDLSGDNRLPTILGDYLQMKELEKETKARTAALRTEILQKMGSADAAIVDGYSVTFKQSERAAHQVKASTSRTLRVKGF